MQVDIKTALIGAIGGLVGGALIALMSHFLGLEASRQELLQTARRNAYVLWLEVRTLSRQADKLEHQGKSDEAAELKREFHRKGREVMGKIATYGGHKVVEAIAAWYRTHTSLKPCACSSSQAKQTLMAEINAQQAMRGDLMPEEDPISDADMALLLLQCELPTPHIQIEADVGASVWLESSYEYCLLHFGWAL